MVKQIRATEQIDLGTGTQVWQYLICIGEAVLKREKKRTESLNPINRKKMIVIYLT